MNSPVCRFCGLPLTIPFPGWAEICQQCRVKETLVVRSWGPYSGALRGVIQAYKFGFRRRLALPLAGLLEKAFEKYYWEEDFDWIVPVPLHSDRRRQRGFDQTYLLAKNLARAVQVPVFQGLDRVKATRPQSGLSIRQRRLNVRSAFEIRSPVQLQGSRILLVDDIYTTGATMAELAKSMQKVAAVDRIAILTVARVMRESWN